MDSPDQDFLKDYKPLHVPHKYDTGASLQDNVVFALAHLEYATAPQVAAKMDEFEPQTDKATHLQQTREVLEGLFNKGRIKGDDKAERQYNLSKILTQNSGKADPLF
ncbi:MULTISPECIES: hypothetical protein [unclassified Mucilaginibacter]|uniref:hypothetical protein n=1 Tax=unclassified Mucilaginibacter TaxID=2617802 RepID=UPI002AC93330|nr:MULTISPECIES: hypothetical protein [unclassified Mucilaginibacter]MEB0263675.1 hypothetical protein [Mucilaginibacter sp. 10I4]MEB0277010.1 hypothetical protein [Mucilaginibacter sp. 10B2]MEB0302616.1 hypothetical protein [Mucilaginibacter sp. 5C4]WPX25110.1 hypothetical protein RHM67_07505 [Mucilaginibacter sp. 5C4]